MVATFEIRRDVKQKGETQLLGKCYWREGYSQKELPVVAFDAASSVGEIEDLLENVTGFFTIITQVNTGWIVGIDCIDSIPVYYTRENGELYVTDSQQLAEDKLDNPTVDSVSAAEYRTATYVTGSNTLYQSLAQSEPGTYIHITDDGIDVTRWFKFNYRDDHQRTVDEVYDIFKIAISRLIEYADGRQIVVPLSGGFDSRLILTTLVDMDYDDLVAISYGLPGNSDSEVSEQVAASLGVEWIYCKYTHDKWYEWYRTEDRQALDNSLWRTTVPPLREWAAVRTLVHDGSIDSDSVIVPGHSGMIVGGKIPETLDEFESNTSHEIENKILEDHYNKNKYSDFEEKKIRERIQELIRFDDGDAKEAMAAFERFDFRERQAKQITAHVWSEEFLGMDWWMPMLDLDFVEFWLHTTVDQRLGKQFFREAVLDIYRQVADNPIERTHNTPTTLWEHTKALGRNSVLSPVLEPLYFAYKDSRGPEKVYERPPTGRLGVMSLDHFKEAYSGDGNLRAYRARALLGEINIGDEPSLNHQKR